MKKGDLAATCLQNPEEITLKEIIEAVGRESIEVKCDFGKKSGEM